ncbi:hypothetical protein OEB99_04950 [Actinotalea sp. M2MS4P-6]|uniref:hypothetical protein n=1 Tax=Actinotalea sp. M2MS4P-6 TaxID=2983762 RepID=UPI0021E50E5B|nr:hypothetical protein [Actinotalea sp. M2MS4P-6]MCV2393649.1 hypothetical protein [Actinotalea sp. M2MS4P-6]
MGPPTSATSGAWAADAETWLQAWLSAWDAGTGEDLLYYAADTTVDVRMLGFPLAPDRAALAPLAAEHYGVLGHVPGSVYLSTDGAVMPLTLVCVSPLCTDADTIGLLQVARIGADGFDALVYPRLTWTDPSIGTPPRRPPKPAVAEQVAADYVAAWRTGDPEAIRELYATTATVTGSLGGVRAVGADAVVDLACEQSAMPAVATAAETFPTSALSAEPDLSPDAPVVAYTSTAGPVDQVWLLLRSEAPCPGSWAVGLDLDAEHRVVAEERFYDIASVRACADPATLPDGWWTARALPEAFADRVTGHLVTDSGSIELRNGTPAAEQLITWALDRFSQAGLTPPAVSSITFDPLDDRCGGPATGYTDWAGDISRILICYDSAGIDLQQATSSLAAAGDATSAESTSRAAAEAPERDGPTDVDETAAARNHGLLLLHELAHAWMAAHADAETEAEFMALVGVDSWNDSHAPWAERGIEWAAQFLAWGLSGRRDQLLFLGDEPRCGLRAEGFRMLTGSEPLTTCTG